MDKQNMILKPIWSNRSTKDAQRYISFPKEKLGFNELGPQISTVCAFKWDLEAKVHESEGILLPIHGILLFCKQNEHPRVDNGSQKEGMCERILDVPSVFPM